MAKLKYIGDGNFLAGLPARDLNENEVALFGKEYLLSTGLYVEIETPKPKHSFKKSIVNDDGEE